LHERTVAKFTLNFCPVVEAKRFVVARSLEALAEPLDLEA